MKKLATILTMFMLVLVLGLSVNITHAESTDLIDDTQISGNSYEVELLANSEYRLIVPGITSIQFQDLDGYMESIEFFTYDSALNESYSYNGSPDVITTLIAGMDITFTTSSANVPFEMNFSGFLADIRTVYDGTTVDIQLLYLSSTGVDEVPPAYTYSSAEIDTPYYDLVTAAEVLAQLSATDPEEGDVTSRISIYSDTYTPASKVVGGSYYIMFVVDDTAGNSAYLQVDINVIDDQKPYMIFDGTTYQNGATINWSWYDDEWNNGLDTSFNDYLSSVTFYDVIDFASGVSRLDEEWPPSGIDYFIGAEDPNDEAPMMESFGYPGTYTFDETITDLSGNVLTIHHHVTVLENNDPVISGPSELTIEVTDIDGDESTLTDLFTATDLEDGSLTVFLDNSGEFMYDEIYLGDTSIKLRATDSLGQVTYLVVPVHLVDTTDPVIKVDGIGTSSYSIDVLMSDTTTLQTFIDALTASDLYEGNLTTSIVVPAFPSFTVPSTTVMNITCTDSSGNQATLALTVNVVDDIIPVINGATKIVKGITSTLVLSEITAELSATDNIDGIIAVELVSDGYTGNNLVLGSYLVQYKATDSAGNIAYHDVRVWVVDNQAPAWVLNDFFVNLGINQSMTRTELVSLLQASGMIGSDISYTVTFVTDEYTGNEDIEGAYSVIMNVVYEDGSEDSITVQLNVPDAEDDGDVIVVTPEEDMTGLQKAWDWIKTAAVDSWNWVKGVGSWIGDKADWSWQHIIKPVYEFIFVKDTDPEIPVYTTTQPVVTTALTMAAPVTTTPVWTTSPIINQV